MIRCSIWALPFDKTRFSSAQHGISGYCPASPFFLCAGERNSRGYCARLCPRSVEFSLEVLRFRVPNRMCGVCGERIYTQKLLLQTGNLCLELFNQVVRRIQRHCSLWKTGTGLRSVRVITRFIFGSISEKDAMPISFTGCLPHGTRLPPS